MCVGGGGEGGNGAGIPSAALRGSAPMGWCTQGPCWRDCAPPVLCSPLMLMLLPPPGTGQSCGSRRALQPTLRTSAHRSGRGAARGRERQLGFEISGHRARGQGEAGKGDVRTGLGFVATAVIQGINAHPNLSPVPTPIVPNPSSLRTCPGTSSQDLRSEALVSSTAGPPSLPHQLIPLLCTCCACLPMHYCEVCVCPHVHHLH